MCSSRRIQNKSVKAAVMAELQRCIVSRIESPSTLQTLVCCEPLFLQRENREKGKLPDKNDCHLVLDVVDKSRQKLKSILFHFGGGGESSLSPRDAAARSFGSQIGMEHWWNEMCSGETEVVVESNLVYRWLSYGTAKIYTNKKQFL
jgi:hypothetical protein